MKIQFTGVSGKTKNYLKNLDRMEYKSLLDLILSLFEKHKHGQEEIIQIEDLLEQIGLKYLKEIPIQKMDAIRETVLKMLPSWEDDSDSEKLTYTLLAAIVQKQIVLLIDDVIIKHIDEPLLIKPDSTIVFLNQEKISAITFKTL